MRTLLILGGTAWLGREVARQAVESGLAVTCLARGASGAAPAGVEFVAVDRSGVEPYAAVRDRQWDAVVDVSWQPGLVAGAVAALADRAGHWTYVSSGAVYADASTPDADETAALLEPLAADVAAIDDYGPAKVRCEEIVRAAMGERALLARAGLIGGPGDPSDRFGYWVSRFALAADEPVLVPATATASTQTIDVRDVAAFLLRAGATHTSGPVNLVGERHSLASLLDTAAATAGFVGDRVPVSDNWLAANGVQPWAGERSLPLWLPDPEYAGFGARADARSLAAGLTRRPLADCLADVLADERARGLDRPRRAGLTRADELELVRVALLDRGTVGA